MGEGGGGGESGGENDGRPECHGVEAAIERVDHLISRECGGGVPGAAGGLNSDPDHSTMRRAVPLPGGVKASRSDLVKLA